MTNLEVSRKLRLVAKREYGRLAVGIPEHAKGFRSDVRDLNRIADLIKKGSRKTARYKLMMLDTAVRDSVPKYIWDFLERGLPEDQRSRWNPRFYKPSKRTLLMSPIKRKSRSKAGSKRFKGRK